jgi:hypothetical protein
MKIRHFLAAVIFVFFATGLLQAQRGYTDFKTEDDVKVMYRWHNVSHFKKDSDAVLNLRVTNQNETPVKWNFKVVFYIDEMAVFESENIDVCINAGRSLRGGLAGLRFTYDGLKLEEVNKPSFKWDFEVFDVEEVESCK